MQFNVIICFLIICLTVSVTRSFATDSSSSESDDRSNSSDNSVSDDDDDDNDDKKKEHSALDLVGSGIIRGIDKTVGKIRVGVDRAIDKVHNGVGQALNTVIKSTNYTINQVHNGVDKTVDKIQDTVEKIKITISNETLGLDTNITFFNGVVDKFKEKVKAIYPGTNWCGDGNRARNYDDLGEFNGTDACCREHDYCPDNIAAGQTKYGLINRGLFTRSHCDCDQKFYDCLKSDGSIISKKIGFTYFTILRPQCFKKECPIISCSKGEHGNCIEYEVERSEQPVFQWFDSRIF